MCGRANMKPNDKIIDNAVIRLWDENANILKLVRSEEVPDDLVCERGETLTSGDQVFKHASGL